MKVGEDKQEQSVFHTFQWLFYVFLNFCFVETQIHLRIVGQPHTFYMYVHEKLIKIIHFCKILYEIYKINTTTEAWYLHVIDIIFNFKWTDIFTLYMYQKKICVPLWTSVVYVE